MMSNVNAKQQCGSRKQAEKRHDRDQKEGGCHTVGLLPIPPALLQCSGLFLSLMVGSCAKEMPGKQNREIGVQFWKAFYPGQGWLHISPISDCLLGMTKIFSALEDKLWDIERQMSLNQALDQHDVFVYVYNASHLVEDGNTAMMAQKPKFSILLPQELLA